MSNENKVILEYGGFQGANYVLSGSTEAGKTTFISKLVTSKARRLIRLMTGQGSSTITEKTFVLSEDNTFMNVIRLAAKPKNQALSRYDFDKKVTEIISELAKQAAKRNVKNKLTAKRLLEERFLKGENYIALLSLIGEAGIEWVNVTAKTLETIDEKTLLQIYDVAKSQLEGSKKSNTKKNESIENKLNEVVANFLDGQLILVNSKGIGEELTAHFIQVNECLLKAALDYFETTKTTRDGYLVLDLDITDSDDEETQKKLKRFFSNNANDMNMSIEVLYSEIIVYLGINEGLVKQLGTDATNFKNRTGMIEIGLLDTMGAFHKQFTDEFETKEYFNNLLKGRSVEGMIMLIPLNSGANDKKFISLAKDFLCNFPFDLNVVLINNKLDVVINQFKSEWKSEDDDAFGESEASTDEPSKEEVQEHLKLKLSVFENNLIQYTEDNGNGRAKIVGHYVTSFTENKIEVTGLGKIGNFSNVAISMVNSFASLLNPIEKLSIKLDAYFGTDIGLKVNQKVLEEELLDVLEGKMFINVSENARNHRGIIPNGNGFNALVRRLKYGEGYESKISEWYVNVQSFNITFPGTIKNSINNNLNDIWLGIYRALDFEGIVGINSKLKEELFIKLLDKIDVRQIVIQAVFNQAYVPILSLPLFSFGAKFQYYMETALNKLGNPDDVEVYVQAIEYELHRAFKEMLDKDIIYKYE